jgi:YggT family protein
MFVVGNLVNALASVLDIVLQMMALVVLINALLTWVRPDPGNPIVMFLDRASDFICWPIRRVLPTVFGGLDLAPLLAVLALWFLRLFLVQTLRDIALRLG